MRSYEETADLIAQTNSNTLVNKVRRLMNQYVQEMELLEQFSRPREQALTQFELAQAVIDLVRKTDEERNDS